MQGVEPIPEEEFEGEGDNAVCVNEEAIYSWQKRDCYARMLIFNANDETRQKALFNCRSSHGMWSRLNTQYLQRAADNKHLLHREFINLRYIISYSDLKSEYTKVLTATLDSCSYVNGEYIMIHVTALESMASQLNDLGVNVSEHDVMTKILCSLPSRFDHLVSSWDSMGDADKTLDALRARLVTEERKINQRIAQGQQPSAGTSQASTSNENNALYKQGQARAFALTEMVVDLDVVVDQTRTIQP
jgi:hypothetical protein